MNRLAEAKAAKRKEMDDNAQVRADALRKTVSSNKSEPLTPPRSSTPQKKRTPASTPRSKKKKDVKVDNEGEYVNIVDNDDSIPSLKGTGSRPISKTKDTIDSSLPFGGKGIKGPYNTKRSTFYIAAIIAIVPLIIATFGDYLFDFLMGQTLIPSYSFCDSDSTALTTSYSSDCIPCPSHGVCYAGYLMTCDGGSQWVISEDRKRCVLDLEFDSIASQLYSVFLLYLRDKHGRYLCGDSFFISNIPNEIGCSGEDLYEYMEEYHEGEILGNKFDLRDLYNEAISRLEKDKNVIVNGRYYEAKRNAAIIPLVCHVGRFTWAYKYYIIGFLVLLYILYTFYSMFIRNKVEEEKVAAVVKDIQLHLKEIRKSTNYNDTSCSKEFIRDHFLGSMSNNKIWNKIEAIIESDTRIRTVPRGTPQRLHWQWSLDPSVEHIYNK